jgi:hypothetical protein
MLLDGSGKNTTIGTIGHTRNQKARRILTKNIKMKDT